MKTKVLSQLTDPESINAFIRSTSTDLQEKSAIALGKAIYSICSPSKMDFKTMSSRLHLFLLKYGSFIIKLFSY